MANINPSLYIHPRRSLRAIARALCAPDNGKAAVLDEVDGDDDASDVIKVETRKGSKRRQTEDDDSDVVAVVPPKRTKCTKKKTPSKGSAHGKGVEPKSQESVKSAPSSAKTRARPGKNPGENNGVQAARQRRSNTGLENAFKISKSISGSARRGLNKTSTGIQMVDESQAQQSTPAVASKSTQLVSRKTKDGFPAQTDQEAKAQRPELTRDQQQQWSLPVRAASEPAQTSTDIWINLNDIVAEAETSGDSPAPQAPLQPQVLTPSSHIDSATRTSLLADATKSSSPIRTVSVELHRLESYKDQRDRKRSRSVGATAIGHDVHIHGAGSDDAKTSFDSQEAPDDQKIVSNPKHRTPRRQATRPGRVSPKTPTLLVKLPRSQPYGLLTPPEAEETLESAYQPRIDKDLLALSKKLTHREPLESKPAPRGQPLVWADSRQALCETVPYFKMPQSGCHSNNQHVYAFLFDNVSGCREYLDPDVIVARAGGGMEPDNPGSGGGGEQGSGGGGVGRMVLGKHHGMQDAQVKAVRNDIAHQNPLVIICGNRNASAPCKLPYRYCVLGWYKPVAVWGEKTAGKGGKVWTTVKYRFERLNAVAPAWHAPATDAITDDERRSAGEVIIASCRDCRQEYDQVYLVSWMCLNPACSQFWKMAVNGCDAAYGELDFHPAFLLHRRAWTNETEPYSVRSAVPDVGNVIGDNLTKINTRGVCCPHCGRCNPRRLFRGWKCENAGCTFEYVPRHMPVKPPMLHSPWDMMGDGPSLAQNRFGSGVDVAVEHIQGYKVFRYTFEGIDGSLVHAVTNNAINRGSRGPDEMFEAMQVHDGSENALQLERRRFGSQRMSDGNKTGCEDGDLMMAFSANYGMPYKFVASGASQAFERAPWPVRTCRSTLNKVSQTFLDPSRHTDFNEELIFAYMEGQKIEYHDDGEQGLGPRIATLSLGGKAKMHMRMKRKHYVGCSLQGLLTNERPKPGSIGGTEVYQQRLAAWEELQTIRSEDRALYESRRRQIPLDLGLFEKRSKWAPDLITLKLHHGDIVLMEGYEIQQYLEHKVVPEGYLRFALTCRTVLADHLLAGEAPEYEVRPDDGTESFL